jgi:MCP family monocarboxylic acid transporter-like MFS transporter 10
VNHKISFPNNQNNMAETFTGNLCIDSVSSTDPESNLSKPENTHQDGGKQAWLTLVGSFLVYYSSFGLLNSFGFFQEYYQKDFLNKASPSTIAFIGTLQLALMNFLSTVAGGICDAHGVKVRDHFCARGCSLTLYQYLYIFSGLGVPSALLILSFCPRDGLWQIFLTQGLLLGVAAAFGVQPACTVVAQHFDKRRARAMSLVCTGGALGGVCYPLLFAKLQPMLGFPWTMRIAAIKVL